MNPLFAKKLYALLWVMIFCAAGAVLSRPRMVPVTDIRIFGTENVSEGDVRAWLGLTEKSPFRSQELYDKGVSVLQGYARRGYPYARIDSLVYRIAQDSSGASIRIYLREGPRLRVGDIELAGLDSSTAAKAMSRFDTKPGDTPDPARLEADLDDVLSQFERQGYPFGRFELGHARLDTLASSDLGLGLKLNAALGPRLVLREIQIAGNKVTKDKVILREIRIKPGEIYDQRKVDQIPQRLMRLGFFDRIYEPQVFLAQGNEGGLLIRVDEGTASRFDGVLGYNPGAGESKGYFTGLVDISLGNLLGTGRSLLAHWQKRDRKTQELRFHYREPWIAGLPVSVGFGFEQLIQDTTYVQRDLTFETSMPLLDNLTAIANVSRNEVNPDSLGSYLYGIPHSRTYNASIGFDYDSRDDLINPRSGVFYSTFVQAGQKRNFGPVSLIKDLDLRTNVSNKRLSMDVEFYAPFFKREVLAVTLHGRQIKSNEKLIPLPDQYRLGGARSLRGFREDQFFGSSIAWSNLELRYIMGRRSRAFVFLDSGYFSGQTKTGLNEGYKIGYGFGVRLETGLGIMGIDYGLSHGDGAFEGKVHVGLINEF